MNQTTIFRFLVVASTAIAVLGVSVDSLVPGLLPPVLEDAYEAYAAAEEPTVSLALALGGLALVLLIAAVLGTIGLLLFKPWGRQLSLWLSVLAMLSYPFLGPVVYSGWATMLTDMEVKVRFDKGVANNAMQSTREDARA